uniref:Uncharacterized protein n=1 Tax=Oryza brachyantha TaxID=4533 RepID=J3M9K6_ORYBR
MPSPPVSTRHPGHALFISRSGVSSTGTTTYLDALALALSLLPPPAGACFFLLLFSTTPAAAATAVASWHGGHGSCKLLPII